MIKKVLFLFVLGMSMHLCLPAEGDSVDYKNSLKEANFDSSIRRVIKSYRQSLLLEYTQIFQNSNDPEDQEIAQWLVSLSKDSWASHERVGDILFILQSDMTKDEMRSKLRILKNTYYYDNILTKGLTAIGLLMLLCLLKK